MTNKKVARLYHITVEQDQYLKKIKALSGKSESDLIREAIDLLVVTPPKAIPNYNTQMNTHFDEIYKRWNDLKTHNNECLHFQNCNKCSEFFQLSQELKVAVESGDSGDQI